MATRTLTDLELRILAFEAKWEGGAMALKGAAGRVEFGWSPAAYEMRLQRLLREPAALAHDAGLVYRATERRERLAAQRASRRYA